MIVPVYIFPHILGTNSREVHKRLILKRERQQANANLHEW